jgi:ribosomal protein S18 acetylase RimI-like enzyme
VNLRRAGSSDADAIRALTREAYAKWVPLIGREPKPMAADSQKAVREHWIDLHEINGELAALIEMVAMDGHLFVVNVAVHPARQGRGLGRALLAHAEAVARGAGYGEIRLLTNAAFAANLALYGRLGYRETKRESISIGGIAVHFGKPVS